MAKNIKTAAQFYVAMRDYIIANSSQITDLNEGSNIRTLLEAISLICGDINLDWFITLDESTQNSIYESFDFPKKTGDRAGGYLTFFIQKISAVNVTIPIGTLIDWNGFFVETTQIGTITAGDLDSGEISALFTSPSTQTNIDVGTINTLISRGSIVDKQDDLDYVQNETSFSGGTNEESDEDRIERFKIFIQGLTRSTIFGLQTGALSVDGIRSADVIELDPIPGWNTIYAEEGNGTLSPAKRAEIIKVIKGDSADPINYPGYKAAGTLVEVKAPIVINITYDLTVKMLIATSYDEATLKSIVKSAVERYTNSLKLGYDVILSEVVTYAQNADEGIYDVVVNVPTTNVTINTGELARTNSGIITITVVEVSY